MWAATVLSIEGFVKKSHQNPSSWSMSHFSVVSSSAAKQAPTMSSEAGAAPVIDESLKDQWKELVGLKKRLIELADEDLSNPAIAASGEARRAL